MAKRKRKERKENWSKIQPLQPKYKEDGYDFHPPFTEVDFFVGEVDQICKDHGYYINVVSFLSPTQFFLQSRENSNENYYVRTRGYRWSVTQVNEESFSSGELLIFKEVETVSDGDDTLQIGKGVRGTQPTALIAEGLWEQGLRTLTDLLLVIEANRLK
jgi:hypothetical protein